MAEYIDREEYCEKNCRCSNEYCDRQSCPIWKAPAADVAPVVRCKDCKHHNKPRLGWCEVHLDRENLDDFCSYGERKDDILKLKLLPHLRGNNGWRTLEWLFRRLL